MRILYLDCGMGAAGDMLMSALLELVPDKDKFVEKINNIGISNVKVKLESSVKCGIKGNHVRVLINDEEELSEDVHNSDELHHHTHTHIHHHAHYHATIDFIEHTIQNLAVSDKVKNAPAGRLRAASGNGHQLCGAGAPLCRSEGPDGYLLRYPRPLRGEAGGRLRRHHRQGAL